MLTYIEPCPLLDILLNFLQQYSGPRNKINFKDNAFYNGCILTYALSVYHYFSAKIRWNIKNVESTNAILTVLCFFIIKSNSQWVAFRVLKLLFPSVSMSV